MGYGCTSKSPSPRPFPGGRGGNYFACLAILLATLLTRESIAFAASTVPAATTRALTTRPSSRDGERARRAIRSAEEALRKEFAAGDLRKSCNYFKDHQTRDITDAFIVAELLSPAEGRLTAYVRWQLLSGLSDKPNAAVLGQLGEAYQAAPAPIPRRGISKVDQQQLDLLLQGRKVSDEAAVKRTAQEIADASSRENQPIDAYRDELYARLPKSSPAFKAALQDLFLRMNAAAEGKELVKALAKDMRDWAASGEGTPQELKALADAVRTLADSKGPSYYSSASWRETRPGFAWSKTRSGIDLGHTLKDLAQFLDEQATAPPLKLDINSKQTKESHGR
jgi:hypothetical protein